MEEAGDSAGNQVGIVLDLIFCDVSILSSFFIDPVKVSDPGQKQQYLTIQALEFLQNIRSVNIFLLSLSVPFIKRDNNPCQVIRIDKRTEPPCHLFIGINQCFFMILIVPIRSYCFREEIILYDKGFMIRIDFRLIRILENRLKSHAETADCLSVITILGAHQHRGDADHIVLIEGIAVMVENQAVLVELNHCCSRPLVFRILQKFIDKVIAVGIVTGQ